MSPIPEMDPLQAAVDEVVTTWPEVKARPVFGHRAWMRSGKMFGFVSDTGVAAKATGALADELMAREGSAYFAYNEMPMKQWVVLPLASDGDVDFAVDAINRAYEAAI